MEHDYGYPPQDMPTRVSAVAAKSEDRDVSPLDYAMARLHDEISELDNRLTVLCRRLESVLRPAQPTAAGYEDGAVDARPIQSQLVTGVSFASERLANLTAVVVDLIHRLEL